MSWIDARISLFDRATATTPSDTPTVRKVLAGIRSGGWQAPIERLAPLAHEAEAAWVERQLSGVATKSDAELRYGAQKKALPAVTFSGEFSVRAGDALVQHSGVLVVDLDHADVNYLRLMLESDPFVAFCFVSPSGHGLKVGLVIDPARHGEAFGAARVYFATQFGAEIDEACKDVCRMCFVSYDPGLYLNENAEPLPITETVPPQSAVVAPPRPDGGPSGGGARSNSSASAGRLSIDDVREMLRFLPTRPAYPMWIRIIAAVAAELDTYAAIAVLREWSPEEVEEEYLDKIEHRLTKVGTGTLVYLAKEHGYVRERWEDSLRSNGAPLPRAVANGRAEDPPPDAPSPDDLPPDAPLPEEPPITGFSLNDAGNGKRLVEMHGEDLHFIAKWNRWLVWTDTRWTEDDTLEIDRRAKSMASAIIDELDGVTNEKHRKRVMAHALASESYGKLRAAISCAASEAGVAIRHTELDMHPMKLSVLNGTLDLRTGNLLRPERADLMTKLAPVIYDPAATCPTWAGFLRQIMQDNDDLIGFLRRALGYAMTGSVSEQCLFFLYGSGANGKSTLLNVVLHILGEYACEAPPGMLITKFSETHPAELATLFGRRLAVCQEVEQGRRLAEATVKQLTGGDRITTRRMREDWWEFDPTHKIFLAANHKPRIKGTDYATWRRIKLIPFTVTIPLELQDEGLKAKLIAERSGILNWLLEGCMEWQEEGLGTPKEVELATEAYRIESDHFAGFLEDRCEINPLREATAKGLYEAYTTWCTAQGEKPMSQRAFGGELTERGIGERKGSGGTRLRTGIGLIDLFSDSTDEKRDSQW